MLFVAFGVVGAAAILEMLSITSESVAYFDNSFKFSNYFSDSLWMALNCSLEILQLGPLKFAVQLHRYLMFPIGISRAMQTPFAALVQFSGHCWLFQKNSILPIAAAVALADTLTALALGRNVDLSVPGTPVPVVYPGAP
jgi:hypothetical protein